MKNTQQDLVCPTRPTPDCFITHAQNALTKIRNEKSRDFARLFIAIAQAEVEKKNLALNTINLINDPLLQNISRISIAKFDIRAGNSDRATKTALEVQKHTGTSPQAYINAWLNSLLAEVFAELENHSQAQYLIDRALESLPLVSDHNTRAELFSLIGTTQHVLGDQSAAENSVKNAIDEIDKFSDPYLKSLALSHIGLTQFKIGQIDTAAETLISAERNAKNSSGQSKAVALAFLAIAQTRSNQIASARDIIHETLPIVLQVDSPYFRALACAFLAQAIFRTEHKST